MFVEIIKRPRGDAPDWVRDAWIGVSLPVHQERPSRWSAIGVLADPESIHVDAYEIEGYAVNALQAVEILSLTNAEAATWWRSNCAAHLDGQRSFLFNSDECALHRES